MTIYEIKRRTEETAPYFFTRKTMKFFNQTLKGYSVNKTECNRYFITCAMRDNNGQHMGTTERYFNPVNNKLELN